MLINLSHLVIVFWITDCLWFFIMLMKHLIDDTYDVMEEYYDEEEDNYDE